MFETVRTTMIEYPSNRIDKIIGAMNKRVKTSKNKGKRLRY